MGCLCNAHGGVGAQRKVVRKGKPKGLHSQYALRTHCGLGYKRQ